MLTLVTFIPLAGALLLLLFPRRDRDIRVFALVVSLLDFRSFFAPAGAFPARRKRDSSTRSTISGFRIPTFITTWAVDGVSMWLVGAHHVSDSALCADLVEIN